MSDGFELFSKINAFQALSSAVEEATGERCRHINASPPVIAFLLDDQWISATVDGPEDDALTAHELAALTARILGS